MWYLINPSPNEAHGDSRRKIFDNESQGIMIIPRWEDRAWYHTMRRIALQWFDIPEWMSVFQDGRNGIIPGRSSWKF